MTGAFQVRLLQGKLTMRGRWLGLDEQLVLQYGSWEWRREASLYPFEEQGNNHYFISYSHGDNDAADHVEALLRRQHCVVLRDEDRFKLGESLDGATRRLIQSADTFLLLYSAKSAESSHCRKELALARELLADERRRGRRVVILKLDEESEIPKEFEGVIYKKAYDRSSRENAIQALNSTRRVFVR